MSQKRKKNILFLETAIPVGPQGVGGSLISLLNIIEGLDKESYCIFILLYHQFDIVDEYKKNGCKVIIKQNGIIKLKKGKQSTIRKTWSNNLKNNLKKISILYEIKNNIQLLKKWKRTKWLIDIIRKNDIDIIHCNNGISFAIEGIIASKLTGKVCVVHQRNFEHNLPYIAKYFAKKVRKFIAISKAIQINLIVEGDIASSKIEVIHNWISPKKIAVQKNDTDNNFKILWIGRLIPWKGAHLLIAIASLLRHHFDDFSIDIFGSYYSGKKEYFLKFKNNIEKSDLSKIIKLKGYKKIAKIYRTKYDLFIHTSVEPEPFGRVIIEAMTNGIPVVATNKGGVLDIIRDGENGFLYDPNEIQELIDKILLIRRNPKIRNKIIRNGYLTVDKSFSEEGKIDQITHIYNNI